jgi:hypothetical protein
MRQYTEEKWQVTTDGEANFFGIATSKGWLLRVQQNGELSAQEEEANIKLIAAAPELLRALIEVIESAKPTDVTPHKKSRGIDLGEFYVGSCGIPSGKAIHMAINAIKKATK